MLSCGDVDDAVILEAARACGDPPIFAVKGNHDRQMPFSGAIRDAHLQAHQLGELQ